jgi:hypothetical protein
MLLGEEEVCHIYGACFFLCDDFSLPFFVFFFSGVTQGLRLICIEVAAIQRERGRANKEVIGNERTRNAVKCCFNGQMA